jgi:RimJ/RimL family protein N-acetyltransferase
MPGPEFLAGDTVSLRTVEEEDVEFLHELVNDRRMWQGFGAPNPRSREDVRERIGHDEVPVDLLICRSDGSDADPVGRVRLLDLDEHWGNVELTCSVVPSAQGEGLATDACRRTIDYAFDQFGVNRVFARVFDTNEASTRLVESLGFTHEGALREQVYHCGEYVDMHRYGLLEREWREG